MPDTTETETQAALDAGRELGALIVDPIPVAREHDIAKYLHVVPDGWRVVASEVDDETLLPAPRSMRRSVTVRDVPSFLAYIGKHKGSDPASTLEVYADRASSSVVAILDAPHPGVTSWEAHRVLLSLDVAPEWTRWLRVHNADGNRWMTQEGFADHIETSLPDIIDPPGADMLEIAQTFSAGTKVEYKSAQRLHDGQTQIVYREETSATAGRDGQLTIPQTVRLALRPWLACAERSEVQARVRYRVRETG